MDPIKTSPFVVPTIIRKEVPKENVPMGDSPLQAVTNHFPQAGENRVTEVPEVIFDLTQGDEGVESPPPKPHQRWRPVMDLSRVNTFLLVERFKMKTPESIRASLIPGEWVSSDAYFHIPVHPNSRKYLRFCHDSQVFQFTSLLSA